jgi:hypothetical protein
MGFVYLKFAIEIVVFPGQGAFWNNNGETLTISRNLDKELTRLCTELGQTLGV